MWQKRLFRDLNPEKVLIRYDDYVKITDFGLLKENIKGDNNAHNFCRTPEYFRGGMLGMIDFPTFSIF